MGFHKLGYPHFGKAWRVLHRLTARLAAALLAVAEEVVGLLALEALPAEGLLQRGSTRKSYHVGRTWIAKLVVPTPLDHYGL